MANFELTDEEKRKLWTQAENEVLAEKKKLEAERVKSEYKKQIEQSLKPELTKEPILIDVAGHAKSIVLDGVEFFHGHTYYLDQNQRSTVLDIMAQTWRHERAIGGANTNAYRAPKDLTISPRTPLGITRV